jgi:putative tricarboxylic transport membrane protein
MLAFTIIFIIFFAGAFGMAMAGDFPSKPMEILISSSPGSGGSIYTQLMAKLGSKYLGVPINVLHKPGGNGNVACSYLYGRPADGHTLNLWNASYAGYMNFPGYSTSPSDFIYLCKMQKTLYCLAVHKDSPFKTIQDLIAYAKKNPGKLDIGSSKLGNPQHLNIVKFSTAAGIEVNYIPYKGTGRAVKDLLGKHLSVAEAQPYLVIPHVKVGNLRILLLFNETRIKELPDIPVPPELGLKYKFYHQAYGIMLKKGVPEDRIATILSAYKKVYQDPEFIDFVKRSAGQESIWVDREEFTKTFYEDFKMVGETLVKYKIIDATLVRSRTIKLD